MFKVTEIAGQLIKSGKFNDAIPVVIDELDYALREGVIMRDEMLALVQDWTHVLLNPSDFEQVQRVGERFISLAMRLPDYVQQVDQTEYKKNIEKSYGPR